MREEVRFIRMVPKEIVRRRRACSVAYLPVGALEWHGKHLPFGTDCISVENISERAARKIGGVAFPVLLYGDVRYWLHDCRSEWRDEYVREMDIPRNHASAFPLEAKKDMSSYTTPTKPDEVSISKPLPLSLEEQEKMFIRLIAYTILEIYLYGFNIIILLPGHGPNNKLCQKAEKLYLENTKRRKGFQPPALTKTIFYFDIASEIEPLLKKAGFNAVVNVMTNHVRNRWARAGYPGLRAKDPTGPAQFISPPLLLQKLKNK